jgi:hypothetical protein
MWVLCGTQTAILAMRASRERREGLMAGTFRLRFLYTHYAPKTQGRNTPLGCVLRPWVQAIVSRDDTH